MKMYHSGVQVSCLSLVGETTTPAPTTTTTTPSPGPTNEKPTKAPARQEGMYTVIYSVACMKINRMTGSWISFF